MRAKIIDRKLYIPKGIIEKAGLPERGECELVVEGDELRVRVPVPEDLAFLPALKRRPVRQAVSEMMKAERVGERVSLVLPERLKTEIESLARSAGVDRSSIMRKLLSRGLTRSKFCLASALLR